MRNDGRRSAHFGGFSERMVSLSNHSGLGTSVAQLPDGELVEPFGWAFRWDRALRQAQRPIEAANGGVRDWVGLSGDGWWESLK